MVQRLAGQMRVIPAAVVGIDMNVAFALAAALGLDAFVVAELLPGIEAAMVRRMNEQIRERIDDG